MTTTTNRAVLAPLFFKILYAAVQILSALGARGIRGVKKILARDSKLRALGEAAVLGGLIVAVIDVVLMVLAIFGMALGTLAMMFYSGVGNHAMLVGAWTSFAWSTGIFILTGSVILWGTRKNKKYGDQMVSMTWTAALATPVLLVLLWKLPLEMKPWAALAVMGFAGTMVLDLFWKIDRLVKLIVAFAIFFFAMVGAYYSTSDGIKEALLGWSTTQVLALTLVLALAWTIIAGVTGKGPGKGKGFKNAIGLWILIFLVPLTFVSSWVEGKQDAEDAAPYREARHIVETNPENLNYAIERDGYQRKGFKVTDYISESEIRFVITSPDGKLTLYTGTAKWNGTHYFGTFSGSNGEEGVITLGYNSDQKRLWRGLDGQWGVTKCNHNRGERKRHLSGPKNLEVRLLAYGKVAKVLETFG